MLKDTNHYHETDEYSFILSIILLVRFRYIRHRFIVSRASPSYSERERVWGTVHIRRVSVKEFHGTNQIAEL